MLEIRAKEECTSVPPVFSLRYTETLIRKHSAGVSAWQPGVLSKVFHPLPYSPTPTTSPCRLHGLRNASGS